MECNEAKNLSPRETLGPLMNEYVETQRKLHETKSQRKRKRLKKELDELKMELGWNFMDCGRYEEGLAIFSSLSWKEHGEIKCNGMAMALIEMKSYDEARRLLEAGLKRYPDSYMLLVGLGTLNDGLGDNFGALKCFEIALQCAPEQNWEAHYNKAISLEKLGSYEEATEILDKLIEEYPEDPKFLAERGNCAGEMGYPQDALRYYQGAMKFWEKNSTVYVGVSIYTGLCSAYFEMGEKREAMEVALEGLKRYPGEDPILYHNVGASFWEMGWKEEARDVLKEGLEKFPEDEELRQFFKDVNDDMDDPDDGIKPSVLGLMLLTAIMQKRFGRR